MDDSFETKAIAVQVVLQQGGANSLSLSVDPCRTDELRQQFEQRVEGGTTGKNWQKYQMSRCIVDDVTRSGQRMLIWAPRPLLVWLGGRLHNSASHRISRFWGG